MNEPEISAPTTGLEQAEVGDRAAAGVIPARFLVVAFAMTLGAVTYFDRVCISVLAPQIMADLHLSTVQMSYVFSAFTLAYAAFEIPTAWYADRIGSRRIVTRIVIWWSVFTMLTAGAWSYASLLVTRFLFGVGEAGAWPNVARVFSAWIPRQERGLVQGFFFASAHLAGGLTPLLVAFMVRGMSWHAIFVLFGASGFIWVAAWHYWYRDEPREHPAVSAAELAKIEAGRIAPGAPGSPYDVPIPIWDSPSLIPLCMMYFANTYGFYFLITWLPTYLKDVRGFTDSELGLFSGLPLLLSVVADLLGDWTTDRLTRRYGLRLGRCVVGGAGYFLAAVCIGASTFASNPRMAAILIAVAAAASMFTLAPSWAACIDIAGRRAGIMSATMNTTGQIGGVLSPIILAQIVARFHDWSIPFYVMAFLYSMATVCWMFIRPDRPLDGAQPDR